MVLGRQSSVEDYGEAVLKQVNAVALVAESALGKGGDERGQLADALLLEGNAAGDVVLQGTFCLFDVLQHTVQVINEEGGSSGGRFYTRVTDHVEDAFVAVVADAGDDGQRKLRHVLGQSQRVKAAEVGGAAAATDNDHDIEVAAAVVDGVKGADDTGFHLFALHDGGEELDGEVHTVGVVFQLADKVSVACGSGC